MDVADICGCLSGGDAVDGPDLLASGYVTYAVGTCIMARVFFSR